MPELPDVEAYRFALTERIAGQRLERVRLNSAFLLRTVDPPLTVADGRLVERIDRLGKRLVFALEGELYLVLHLMIAGRLHWRPPAAKLAGRNMLAGFDFPNGTLTLTEAGTKRRASLHVVQGADALAALDPGGVDVLSITLPGFRDRLSQENRTLKRALTDPRILSGIGNAYSDEILHAARLSPILQTAKLTGEQWAALHAATIAVLTLWRDRFIEEARAIFPEKVTAFREGMAVHGRFGQPCPTCGEPIQCIRYADNETNYCARCQNAGRLLADRSLSRLLAKDWPKTLDELELMKRPKP